MTNNTVFFTLVLNGEKSLLVPDKYDCFTAADTSHGNIHTLQLTKIMVESSVFQTLLGRIPLRQQATDKLVGAREAALTLSDTK